MAGLQQFSHGHTHLQLIILALLLALVVLLLWSDAATLSSLAE